MINITINNNPFQVEDGSTILDAAKKAGVHIPTLCHLDMHDFKMVNRVGTCRVCMVEVEGRRNLIPACSTVVAEGMVIRTNTIRAIKARRTIVELLLSNHPKDCLICERNQNCELQSLAAELGIREVKYQGYQSHHKKDTSSYSLIRNAEKCILCRRCETMCNEVQTVGVYSAVNRGFETVIGTAFDLPMIETACTFCGQCVSVCPTGALTLVDNTAEVWAAIYDPEKYVIVQTAPAIRAALGEVFQMPVGSRVTGKMTAALRRLGFDLVCDTDFAADLTIMEEANELLDRLKNNGTLPILTSCCPAWVKFIEHQFPDLLDIPSTCKSPHEMFGAIAKTHYAQKLGIDPEKIVVVSVMPCLAKKYEAARPELAYGKNSAYVDYVISTRELGSMIREAGITFADLPDEDFDSIMGESTGASVIFGTTGGVIEAALRTAVYWLTGEKLDKIDFEELRGMQGIRSATIDVQGTPVRIGIAHGLGNARALLEAVRGGEKYHAIEIMACPGGCVGGGGQPYHGNNIEIIKQRADALYQEDKDKSIRRSHENTEIQRLYEEFLETPGSHKAHELLHTTYTKREKI
ncbi:MAG: [FeFe] hydrogenase, group A [Clostridiales bacterium]|jgi:NADH-quinone oxidoreductase subunit G|nr:[FeFe] hydrogenase, group A [Clostridiales bacterium]